MLNLSDKELDRLSREAAQEYDPGDVLGPQSWEKLAPRLDSDLGKGGGSNPLRGIRRFPFYYVPAILLVAGVFYFVRQAKKSQQNEPSGSPPSAATQSAPATTTQPDSATAILSLSSTQNSNHSTNSTPSVTPPAPAAPAGTSAASGTSSTSTPPAAPASTEAAAAAKNATATGSTGIPSAVAATRAGTPTGTPSPDNARKTSPAIVGTAAATKAGMAPSRQPNTPGIASSRHPNRTPGNTRTNTPGAFTGHAGNPANTAAPTNTTDPATGSAPAGASTPGSVGNLTNSSAAANITAPSGTTATPGATSGRPARSHELTLSTIRSPRSLKQPPAINDSALRAYKTPPAPIQLAKNKSLHINRSLQVGVSIAPDFSSVNSLAGDKPGSTIGVTLDYHFANRWYLSTGLLLDRKNYAAREQDYHVPYDFYRLNDIHNLNFVKGSFNMLEIPLNLRYDFSVTGNTLFFASAGVSSYLLTTENTNYYINMFGREICRSFNYSDMNNYLCSSINLSLGVETGISNSLSLLIAPYVKLPSRKIGFGQVQMNSVGINFALKFAPVLSQRRR